MGILKTYNYIVSKFNKIETQDKFKKKIKLREIKLNVIKDRKDKRDFHIKQLVGVSEPTLPKSASLVSYATAIKNQGSTNSCSGFASTGVYEVLRNKNLNQALDLSELFIYYNARKNVGHEGNDNGAYLREICKTATKDGFALEQFWPFDTSKVLNEPTWQAYMCAKYYKLGGYYRCYTKTDIKKAINAGKPIIFGLRVTNDFMNFTGDIFKEMSGTAMGGHAMSILGYSDDKNAFLVRNSWGSGWDKSGYVWIDYDVLIDNLIDAWAFEFKKPTILEKVGRLLMI